jgi:hypothetical protein
MDPQLARELLAEDWPAAAGQARALGLELRRGKGDYEQDVYVSFTAPDGEQYLLRLRCDGYDEVPPSFQFVNPTNPDEAGPRWWPRMELGGLARGERGEIVYCTAGIREYHQHPSHRHESHPKTTWKLARVVSLAWHYLNRCGRYLGRGV